MSDENITGPAADARLGWRPIAVLFIVISAALGGMLAYGKLTESHFQPMEVSATVEINYGNGTILAENITTDNYTAFGFLEAAVGHENIDATYYESFGSWLINGINGIANGVDVPGINDTGAYYWQYYVNDELGLVGADRYALLDGDVLEWRFEEIIW